MRLIQRIIGIGLFFAAVGTFNDIRSSEHTWKTNGRQNVKK
jgi:hypothetical protein